MKKIIIPLILLIFISNIKASEYKIPEEAIRFIVIANSNSKYDQDIKYKVRDKVQLKLYNLLKDTKGIKNARNIINDNLNDIDNIVKNTLKEENYNKDYNINFGNNYFPEKTYKGITYPEGYYESLVVTLGEGKGNNWWCVLFPPLCIVEAEESTKVEYKFFIKELIDKYL